MRAATANCALRIAAPSVIPVSKVEDVQRAEQPHLIKELAAILGNGKASIQGRLRPIAAPAGKHQRIAQPGLQAHFLGRSALGLVESQQRLLRPAITFGQQGRGRENRHGGDGQSDADVVIAPVGEKAQSSAARRLSMSLTYRGRSSGATSGPAMRGANISRKNSACRRAIRSASPHSASLSSA